MSGVIYYDRIEIIGDAVIEFSVFIVVWSMDISIR